MDTQDRTSCDLLWAAGITLFAAGVLFGAGLARLTVGEPASAAFYCLLGGALAWASALTSRGAGA